MASLVSSCCNAPVSRRYRDARQSGTVWACSSCGNWVSVAQQAAPAGRGISAANVLVGLGCAVLVIALIVGLFLAVFVG